MPVLVGSMLALQEMVTFTGKFVNVGAVELVAETLMPLVSKHPPDVATVRPSRKDEPQFVPDTTETVCWLAAPEIVPLPDWMTQA